MASKLEDLYKKIADLQAEAEDVAQKEKSGVIQDIKSKIYLYHITARELGFGTETARVTVPGVIRYRKGDQAWTGKGRKPAWVIQHLEAGGTLQDLQV